MKAALLNGLKNLVVKEIADPVLGQGEILIALKATGICGSDVHYYNQGRIGSAKCIYPQMLGHECSGVVVKTFTGSRFKIGDRVAIEPGLPCHSCEHCLSGHYNRCPSVCFLGSPNMPGGFAQYIAVAQEQLFPIPDSMSFIDAAILEPLGVAYHAIMLADLKPAQSIAIFGAGPIGLLTLAMARACGCGETFIFDRLQYRLDFACKKYGANHAVNVEKCDPLEYIKGKTRGRGVDITFEAAAEQATFSGAFESARIGGRVMLIGIPEVDTLAFDPHSWRRKELLIQNVRRSNLSLEATIRLVESGRINLSGLATHIFPLERIVEAFEMVGDYRDDVLRAMVTFE